MAYLRYGPQSDWYVYWCWGEPPSKEDERLAAWHVDHQAASADFSYRQVRAMLDQDDFSPIPGFQSSHHAAIKGALTEFVRDVDAEYETPDRGALD